MSGNFPENPASKRSGNFFSHFRIFFWKSRRKIRKFFPGSFQNFFPKKPDENFFQKFFRKIFQEIFALPSSTGMFPSHPHPQSKIPDPSPAPGLMTCRTSEDTCTDGKPATQRVPIAKRAAKRGSYNAPKRPVLRFGGPFFPTPLPWSDPLPKTENSPRS